MEITSDKIASGNIAAADRFDGGKRILKSVVQPPGAVPQGACHMARTSLNVFPLHR